MQRTGTRVGQKEAGDIVKDISNEIHKKDRLSLSLASLSCAARFCCKRLSALIAESPALRAGIRKPEEYWTDMSKPRQYVEMLMRGNCEAAKRVQPRIWRRAMPGGGVAVLFYEKPRRPGQGGTLSIVLVSLINEWSDAVATIGGSNMCGEAVYPAAPLDQVDKPKPQYLDSFIGWISQRSGWQINNHGAVCVARRGRLILFAAFTTLDPFATTEPAATSEI